jgi:hypothetical protein
MRTIQPRITTERAALLTRASIVEAQRQAARGRCDDAAEREAESELRALWRAWVGCEGCDDG